MKKDKEYELGNMRDLLERVKKEAEESGEVKAQEVNAVKERMAKLMAEKEDQILREKAEREQ